MAVSTSRFLGDEALHLSADLQDPCPRGRHIVYLPRRAIFNRMLNNQQVATNEARPTVRGAEGMH